MHVNTKIPRWNRYRVNTVFFPFALSFNFFSIIYRWRKIHYENMTFSSNCCVRYNPKDSLVILMRNNALTKYRIISHDLAKKHINISLVQPAKMLPKSSYNLAQDYSLTLPRILTAQCVLIDVEAQGEMFPGCGQARRISWEMARHCGKHWQLSAQNVTGLFKFKNRGEGRGWGGGERKISFTLKQILGKKSLMSWFWARPLFFRFV